MNREQSMEWASGEFAFHKSGHLLWRRVGLIELAIILLLVVAVVFFALKDQPIVRGYGVTPDGRIIEFTPLSEPMQNQRAIHNWIVTAATEAYTLGHHDWRMRLSQIREYFTEDGYASYVDGLEDSLFLKHLRDNRQVTSAVAQGAPVVLQQLEVDGRYASWVQFPMLLTFDVGRRNRNERVTASVLIMRVPFNERPTGWAIQQLIVEKNGG